MEVVGQKSSIMKRHQRPVLASIHLHPDRLSLMQFSSSDSDACLAVQQIDALWGDGTDLMAYNPELYCYMI